MKLISGMIGIVILFYLCFLPIYLLFFNSSEDAIDDMSLLSICENYTDILYNDSRSFKKLQKYCDKKGINISEPVIDMLKNDKNVSDIKIKLVTNLGRYTQNYSDLPNPDIYVLSWKYNQNYMELVVLVIPPSFFKIRRAKAVLEPNNLLLAIYDLTQSEFEHNLD